MRGGLLIRAARKDKGYKQLDLAVMYGVSCNALVSWESGKREPKYFDTQGILDFLGFTIPQAMALIDNNSAL